MLPFKKIKNSYIYIQESIKLKASNPEHSYSQDLRYFPRWEHSLQALANPLEDEQPWITFPAINFLEKILMKHMSVFEYGSGGSTVFFSKRAEEVVSVEHDKSWYLKVSNYLKVKDYTNCQLHLIEPESNLASTIKNSADPGSYISSSDIFCEKSFRGYASSIEKYQDNYFDVVLIDGRSRPSCFHHAFSKVKQNGFILLDNAERSHYSYIHEYLYDKGWRKYDFSGPGPYNHYFWKTCAWRKP
ncbi:MAG: hypothetical protein KME12_07090 [Trichocoleus desertorum ATA4-8-CV12]|jgi:hypothetical protein|nr:hypothetical protein [Trichocoleus desertorum ATA4-8-CV12]